MTSYKKAKRTRCDGVNTERLIAKTRVATEEKRGTDREVLDEKEFDASILNCYLYEFDKAIDFSTI